MILKPNIMLGKDNGRWFIDIGWFKSMPWCCISLKILDDDSDLHFDIFRLQIGKFIVEFGIWK